MKAVIFGSNGFIGRNVCESLRHNYEVIEVERNASDSNNRVDLTDRTEIYELLKRTLPEVIVNCAGVTQNDETAKMNKVFTENILASVLQAGLTNSRIVVSGSASVYGVVENAGPVSEVAELKGESLYATSKIDEEKIANEYRDVHGLRVIVVRIFNPIGPRMPERLLASRLTHQARAISSGERTGFEVSRRDAKRDYIDVRDVANAIGEILLGNPQYSVYNIGSGVSSANEDIIKALIEQFGLSEDIEIAETSQNPEPLYAACADLTRMRTDFDWSPNYGLVESIKELVNEKS